MYKKRIRSLSNPFFMVFVKDENNLHFLLKYLLFNKVIFPLKMLYFYKNFFLFGYSLILRKRLEPFFIITLFWNYFKYEFRYEFKFSFILFTNSLKYNLIKMPLIKLNIFKYNISKKEIKFRYINYLIFYIKNFEMHSKIIFKEYFLEDVLFSRQYNILLKILYCGL